MVTVSSTSVTTIDGTTCYKNAEDCSRTLRKNLCITSRPSTKLDGVKVWHKRFRVDWEYEYDDVDVRIEEYEKEVIYRYWYRTSGTKFVRIILKHYFF